MASALKKWLRNEGFWLYSDKARNVTNSSPTHVFFDGGKAIIPPERVRDFFDVYASCVVSRDVPSCIERIPYGRFRMFADIDFAAGLDLSEDTLCEIVSSVAAATGALSTRDDEEIVACRKTGEGARKKEGLHLVWNSIVSESEARRWVAELPPLPEGLSYDTSVYAGTGLRMVFSGTRVAGVLDGNEKPPIPRLTLLIWFNSQPRDVRRRCTTSHTWSRAYTIQLQVPNSPGCLCRATIQQWLRGGSNGAPSRAEWTPPILRLRTREREDSDGPPDGP